MVWADDTVDLYLKLHDGTDDGELGYMDAGEWHAKSASCFWLQYNNVGTAMVASNVQDAITELSAKIEALTP
jgi:hypothetical protein